MSGRAKTEKSCVLSWFMNWNDEQRQEFAKSLQERFTPTPPLEPSLEVLLSGLDKLAIQSNEGPSVFECQLKIFSRWFPNWPPEEQTDFFQQLALKDSRFSAIMTNAQMY